MVTFFEHANYDKSQNLARSSITQISWSNSHRFHYASAEIIQRCYSNPDFL